MVDQDSVIPDCHGKDLTTDEKDKILFKVAGQYPGPENTHKRAKILNNAGVTCGKDRALWTAKKFNDNFKHAKKRQGKT